MTQDPSRIDIPADLRSAIDALAAEHGLAAVIGAVLDASTRAGTPYGASTPVNNVGTLNGHGPCFHCGASQPTGEMWEADETGVLCTVRCGACGRDYGEYYFLDPDRAEAAQRAIE
ncbi:MAG: hypothetical protein AAFQ43_09945 [Bacteroidota bacterium]